MLDNSGACFLGSQEPEFRFLALGRGCLPEQAFGLCKRWDQPSLVETGWEPRPKEGRATNWDLSHTPAPPAPLARGDTFGSTTGSQNCGCGTCLKRFHSSALLKNRFGQEGFALGGEAGLTPYYAAPLANHWFGGSYASPE